MKKIILSLTLLVALSFFAQAQTQVNLKLNHKLGTASFALNQTATNNSNQDFQLTRLEYYISNIKIIHDNGMETAVPKTTLFLVDANAPFNENLGSYNVTNIEGISFSIGVDTPENHADPTTWPAGHPLAPRLSPLKQMNWGWTAGYRFLALEGIVGTDVNNIFEIHSLEDPYYYNHTIYQAGVAGTSGIDITLDANYLELLRDISIVDGGNSGITEHGSSTINIKSLQNFYPVFGGVPLDVQDVATSLDINIYPNPSSGKLFVDLNENKNKVSNIEILDVTGKVVLHKEVSSSSVQEFQLSTPGIYLIKLNSQDVNLGVKKVVIQ